MVASDLGLLKLLLATIQHALLLPLPPPLSSKGLVVGATSHTSLSLSLMLPLRFPQRVHVGTRNLQLTLPARGSMAASPPTHPLVSKAIIVGGGLGGLSAALQLRKAGIDAQVLHVHSFCMDLITRHTVVRSGRPSSLQFTLG